jgi:sugar phosphate isomerase/epimerase
MSDSGVRRRDFLRIGGASAAVLGASGVVDPEAEGRLTAEPNGVAISASPKPAPSPELAPDSKYPKLAMITPYSPQKLAFATATGYEGVVIPLDQFFDPDKLADTQIDQIISTSRETGARIISIECMWGINHIEPDPTKRANANARFIRCIELAHRLGCKFVGTFSGGMPGATGEHQARELAQVVNEKYVPVLDKYDMHMGWENYPTAENFATVPELYEKIFELVPSHRLGLEYDPSHFVRQYVDPIATAWRFRDRIFASHAKDTEIIEPVLQQVGIHGKGWWRYRIPGQGVLNWARFITVLLQAGFHGGLAVEHEDDFWDLPNTEHQPDFPQERKDGFILAYRFLRMYLPARLS